MGIGKSIDGVEECQYLTIVFQETDDRFVESCQLFVGFIATGIVSTSTVKHIAATIATLVFWYAFAVRETIDLDHQWSLRIVFRESGRTVLWMLAVRVMRSSLVAIGSTGCKFYLLELRQFYQALEQVDEIGIGGNVPLPTVLEDSV